MSDMNELNEQGGQKCPVCGKQTMALGELTLIHGPEGIFTLYVRKWLGVDCEHSYLEILDAPTSEMEAANDKAANPQG